MKRLFSAVFITALLAVFAISFQWTYAQESVWTADFFNNPYLYDPAIKQATYEKIDFHWGNGRPIDGIPADNFSVRFTRDVWFPESGIYRFTINADDTFQLGVDQVSLINTLDQVGPAYTRTFDLMVTAGVHTVQLDYVENTGIAYLQMTWDKLSSINATATAAAAPTQQPAPANTGQNATILVPRLNVRSEANLDGDVITVVTRGQSFPIVNRNTNWVQINVNGRIGWVSALYVSAAVTTAPVQAAPTGANSVRASVNINLRVTPDLEADVLNVVARGDVVTVIARTADNNWLYINDGGRIGWITARLVTADAPINFNSFPIYGS